MKRYLSFIIIMSLSLVLMACGDNEKEEKAEEKADEDVAQQANEEIEVTDEEKINDDKVVANINDQDVVGTEYNALYAQTKMQMHQLGQDIEDLDAVKDHTLEELIAQELVKQDAEKQGVEVTDEEVEKELGQLKEENKEVFDNYLDEFELSEETFKEQITFSLMLDKYMDDQIETDDVSEDEVKEMYETLKEQNDDIAEYDELKEDIKVSLENQQKQEKLQVKLDELKEDADVEELI